MGIDVLDIKFNLEREFDITFDDHLIVELFKDRNPEAPPSYARTDIRVSQLIDLVAKTLARTGRNFESDMTARIRMQVSESLSIPLEHVRPDSWIVADLGAE